MDFEYCKFVDLVRALVLCHDFYSVDEDFKNYVDILVAECLMKVEKMVEKRRRPAPVFQFVPPNSDK